MCRNKVEHMTASPRRSRKRLPAGCIPAEDSSEAIAGGDDAAPWKHGTGRHEIHSHPREKILLMEHVLEPCPTAEAYSADAVEEIVQHDGGAYLRMKQVQFSADFGI